ncbi:hypothetical protein FSP39_017696 [Pinctada imbricata]|uniref:Phosphomevalonate kinase n=1 Tax=Pinctada imbricata TaxID=66713 RepID=A0AA89BW05_PINIB|nr:hypothetical protein FSP39_017696 [Pinctada imbricata]
MIQWGEEKRKKDPEFFCQLATSGQEAQKRIWIISDARRTTDVEYFMRHYQDITVTVRVEADLSTRKNRGFQFQSGVDDAESECGLDQYDQWNYIINNNIEETEINPSFGTNEKFLLLLQNVKSRIGLS